MSDNNRDGLRKHIMGSLKSRFNRRNDSDGAAGPARAVSPIARGLVSPIDTAPAQAPRSPLANPSEPTRRPNNELPPPYTSVAELPGSASGASPAAAAPAPVSFSLRPASPTLSQRSGRSAGSMRPTADNVRSEEDPYAFLSMFDTIFVIDDSGSMAGRPWREVQAVLSNITPICTERDADGIDIYFLNHKNMSAPQAAGGAHQQPRVPPGKATGGYYNVRDAASVERIFQTVRPGGATPTGTRLHNILQPYLRYYDAKRLEMAQRGEYGDPDPEDIKPVNIIVITDGVPTDDLDRVLVNAAQRLDNLDAPHYQVGVQFFQVGNEPEAAAYLQQLDDNLDQNVPGGLRDMVDTVTWDAFIRMNYGNNSGGPSAALGLTVDGVLKAVLGAVVKRLDHRPTGPAASSASNPNAHQYLAAPRH